MVMEVRAKARGVKFPHMTQTFIYINYDQNLFGSVNMYVYS